jgi:hypothetical protein
MPSASVSAVGWIGECSVIYTAGISMDFIAMLNRELATATVVKKK